MNFSSIQQSFRPPRESSLQLLVPIFSVLISGLVIILTISPEYLRELNPVTLLLLAISCALPIWAWNQLLWWHIGRSVSGEIVAKMSYILDVPEERKKAYAFALSMLLKSLNVLRFVPYREIANLATVITIYAGGALCYLAGSSPATLYGCIIGLSVLVWIIGLFALHRSCRKIDVEPLRELWHELKNKDELLETIHGHVERMEKLLVSYRGQDDVDAKRAGAEEQNP
jgi:hypothetical protein